MSDTAHARIARRTTGIVTTVLLLFSSITALAQTGRQLADLDLEDLKSKQRDEIRAVLVEHSRAAQQKVEAAAVPAPPPVAPQPVALRPTFTG